MKVGDLVSVKTPVKYVGIVTKVNVKGGGLVQSLDSKREYWIYNWSGEVISESR